MFQTLAIFVLVLASTTEAHLSYFRVADSKAAASNHDTPRSLHTFDFRTAEETKAAMREFMNMGFHSMSMGPPSHSTAPVAAPTAAPTTSSAPSVSTMPSDMPSSTPSMTPSSIPTSSSLRGPTLAPTISLPAIEGPGSGGPGPGPELSRGNSGSGLSPGGIAGIVVGSVVGVALVATVGVVAYRKSQAS